MAVGADRPALKHSTLQDLLNYLDAETLLVSLKSLLKTTQCHEIFTFKCYYLPFSSFVVNL